MTLRDEPHPVEHMYSRRIAHRRGIVLRLYCTTCHRRAGISFSGTLTALQGGSPAWKHHIDERYDIPVPTWLVMAEWPDLSDEPFH